MVLEFSLTFPVHNTWAKYWDMDSIFATFWKVKYRFFIFQNYYIYRTKEHLINIFIKVL